MQPDATRQTDLDLHVTVPVPLEVLLFGGRVEVPTADGPVAVTVGRDALTCREIRLAGRGHVGRDGFRGDVVGRVDVHVSPATVADLRSALGAADPPEGERAEDDPAHPFRARLRRHNHRLLLRERSRAVRARERRADRKWRRSARAVARRRLLRIGLKRLRRTERAARVRLQAVRSRERAVRRREEKLREQDAALEASRQQIAAREASVEAREAASEC